MKRRAAAVLLGIVMALVVLEVILRVVGIVHTRRADSRQRLRRQKAIEINIEGGRLMSA